MTDTTSTVDATHNMPRQFTPGQLWDDDQLHDIRSHRAPRQAHRRPRRVALAAVAALAMLGASDPGPKQEAPTPAVAQVHNMPAEFTPAALVDERTDERAIRHVRPAANTPVPAAAKPVLVAPRPAQPAARPSSSKAETAVQYALAQLGDPYRWAAAGPNAYDCSGLVLASFKRIGVTLPHYTGDMIRYGTRVSRAELRRGDLVFWSGHVAIYLGGGRIVHASSSKGRVVIATLYGTPIAYRRLT